MKLVSWNVNGVRAASKKGLMEFVKSYQPDVLCLQETKAEPHQVEASIVADLGQFGQWSWCQIKKGYSGTATFTQAEYATQSGVGIQEFDQEGRFVVTQLPQFELYNVYFPNGASGAVRQQYKMRFLESFKSHIQKKIEQKKPVVVVGDFNIAPADIDIYDPVRHQKTSGFLPEEKIWFSSFLEMGMLDSFRHLHPETKNKYSWWNQIERARIQNRGWRIDMICVSKDLAPYLKSADIHDDVLGSDHCPISVQFEFKG